MPAPGAAVAAVRECLERWPAEAGVPLDARQEELRRRYLVHLEVPGALEKTGPPDHLTASALVLDPSGTRTLLVLHRRGGFWVQPGGHLEASDASTRHAALRELVEETGVPATLDDVSAAPADLDHHELGAAFGRCRSHLDVAHLVVLDPTSAVAVSDESDDVAWWPLAALPDGADGGAAVVPDLPARLRRAAAALGG